MGRELKRIKDVLVNKDYVPGKPGNEALDKWMREKGLIQALKIKKGKKKKPS
tara:strand:+ start:745 stop:900 length:156 start_codon:yes stop_codon:yes gene_type:complete